MKNLKVLHEVFQHGKSTEKPCWKCKNGRWIALVPQTSLAEFNLWIQTGGYSMSECSSCGYYKVVEND